MKVEYTYKTSDGKRHVETMNARSTDAAFAILRERGIKPIRVVRAKPDGFVAGVIYSCTSTAGIAVAVAVVAVVLAVIAVLHDVGKLTPPIEPGVPRVAGETFKKLTHSVSLVERAHAEAFASIDFELLRNYALIAEVSDLQKLYGEITKARIIIGNTRERLRAIFAEAPALFTNDKDGFSAAQALYGAQMSKVDADEAQIESDEAAITLLDEARDQWKVVKGELIFSNDALKKDFEMLTQSVNPSTVRWHKDFAPKAVIESAIIEIPRRPSTK